MKTNCDNVMIALAEGETLSPEQERHLEACPDCALFRRTLALKNDDPGPKVPQALDAVILQAAQKQIVHRKWRIWKIVLPVAASFAVCFGFAFYAALPQTAPVGRPAAGQSAALSASSWSTSDFDDNLIALSCDVASGYTAISNVYDTWK